MTLEGLTLRPGIFRNGRVARTIAIFFPTSAMIAPAKKFLAGKNLREFFSTTRSGNFIKETFPGKFSGPAIKNYGAGPEQLTL